MAYEESLKSISLAADASIAGYTGVSNVGLGGFPSSKSLTATVSYASSVNTFTTPTPHGFSFGDTIVVTGATAAGNNGTFTITGIASATTFTVANATPGVTQSTAGITVTRNISTAGNQYRFVKVTGSKTAGLCTSASDYSIGVLQNKPQVVGAAAQVGFIGVSFVVSGDTGITAGAKVTSDSLGAATRFLGGYTNALSYSQGSTSSTFSSPTVTMTLGAAGTGTTTDVTSHGVQVGDIVNISYATTAANNGTFVVTAVGATTISYINAAGAAEAGRASSATKVNVIRNQVIAGTALASSSTAGELIPVLLAAR